MKGNPTDHIQPSRAKKICHSLTYEEISRIPDYLILDLVLIAKPYCFADYYVVAKVAFSKQMAIIKRKVEAHMTHKLLLVI